VEYAEKKEEKKVRWDSKSELIAHLWSIGFNTKQLSGWEKIRDLRELARFLENKELN